MPADSPAPDDVVVMPVVVDTKTFHARPSALPDAEEFVRQSTGGQLEPADLRAVFAAIREAILAAASPEIGAFQITVRSFPDGVEVEVLSDATAPSEPMQTAVSASVTDYSFAAWLADMLAREGLSHQEAAHHLGVSVRTISRWIRGETEPRLRDLRRVEEVLGPGPIGRNVMLTTAACRRTTSRTGSSGSR